MTNRAQIALYDATDKVVPCVRVHSTDSLVARIKYMDLPTFAQPIEFLEVDAHFPGAISLI
jgi:hypothetical protein